jgi:hypothetical protein
VRDKTKLRKALKETDATIWQIKAASILFKINGIENALKYVKQVKRRNIKNHD